MKRREIEEVPTPPSDRMTNRSGDLDELLIKTAPSRSRLRSGAVGLQNVTEPRASASGQQHHAPTKPLRTASDRDAAMRVELLSGYREAADKGFAALLNKPGLGVEVNEKALDSYSEERI